MQKIILIGDSGHSKVIEDCVRSNGDEVVAKLDDRYSERLLEGSVVKGPIAILPELFSIEMKIFIAIEQNETRKQIVDLLNLPNEIYATVVHKSAIIGTGVQIGVGTAIMPGVVVNADSRIGEHVILNSNSTIEHDCVVESFAHIETAATLTGGVSIGAGTQVGAGSTVIPSQSIGDWSVIGAGSTVTTTIPPNVTAVGVPAKVIEEQGF